MLTIAYWTLPSQTPFRFYGDKSPVFNKTVQAGSQVNYLADFEVEKSGQQVRVARTIEGKTIVPIPATEFITEKGRRTVQRFVDIPEYLPSGQYFIRATNYIRVNPMKTVIVIRDTETFSVVNNRQDKE